MGMPQVSIITRCLNRLEYTAQVVDAVRRLSSISYEHIIVDNASTDGTREWFKWISKNTNWYNGTLRYYRMDSNIGDWGGMLAGFMEAKGEYIVQLDNDIIPCEGWLKAMIDVLLNTSYKVIMLRRANVAWKLKPLSVPKDINGYQVAKVERAVACYMMRKEDFALCAQHIPANLGMRSKYIMAGLTKKWKGLTIGKILNRTCIELQAEFQRQKYSPKNPEIWKTV